MPTSGNCGLPRRGERPVRFVFGSLLDPLLQRLDLLRRQRLLVIRRRHHARRIGRRDAADQFALVRLAGDDRRESPIRPPSGRSRADRAAGRSCARPHPRRDTARNARRESAGHRAENRSGKPPTRLDRQRRKATKRRKNESAWRSRHDVIARGGTCSVVTGSRGIAEIHYTHRPRRKHRKIVGGRPVVSG